VKFANRAPTVLGLLVAGLVASTARDARAQGNTALSEALFRDAQRLEDAGDLAAACPMFAESQRLEPRSGTLLNLARCHERQGRTATAWAEYTDAASRAEVSGDFVRRNAANERAAALAPHLGTVVFVGAEASGIDEIRIDGVVLGRAAWGRPLPFDPGLHQLTLLGTGRRGQTRNFEIAADGGRLEVALPQLAVLPREPQPSPTATASTVAAAPTEPGTTPLRTISYFAGGAGIAAMGVGTIFGLQAKSSLHDLQGHCHQNACDREGYRDALRAQANAQRANIAFAGGFVALGTGVALYLLGAPARSTSVALIPRFGSTTSLSLALEFQ
jgi:hypothetical protein